MHPLVIRLIRVLSLTVPALLGLSVIIGTPARAQYVVVGSANSSNFYPFGSSAYVGEYQQAYASSAFSGPVTITQIAFSSKGTANAPITDDLSLSLSTTSTSLSSLSDNYAANIGPDNTVVFSGVKVLTPLDNDTFDIVFDITPFTYDPSLGNLLLDVNVNANTGGTLVMVAGVSPDVSRVYNTFGSSTVNVNTGFGLLTQFTVAVPEPGSIAMLVALSIPSLVVIRKRINK